MQDAVLHGFKSLEAFRLILYVVVDSLGMRSSGVMEGNVSTLTTLG
jgi:hypothetical protein